MKQAMSQKEPRRGGTRQPNKPRKLITADLRDNAKVLEWYAATKTASVSLYDAELFNVFAAAECALDHGENPPALFAWIIHGRRWGMLTNEQDDAARQRVLKLRNPEREAKRRRRHDDDDSTGELSEPLFVGDIVRELINKLFPPTNPNPSETIHA